MKKKILDFIAVNNFLLISISGIIGQIFFYYLKLPIPGAVFFVTAFIVYAIYGKNKQKIRKVQISKKTEIAGLLIIIAAAVLCRFVLIDKIPAGCFSDEAQNGSVAESLKNTSSYEGTFLPVYITGHTHNPTAFVYMITAVFKFLGTGAAQIRMTAAIVGVIAVPAFYFLIRYLLGPAPALCGAFLLAVLRWHINFSRLGFHCILSVTILILLIYFTIRAYKEKKLADFLAMGLTAALSQYTYQAARLAPVWLILYCIYIAIFDTDFFRNNWKKAVAAILLAAAVYMPLGIYSLNHSKDFFMRQKQVFVLDKDVVKMNFGEGKSVLAAFVETGLKTVGMFNVYGDENPRHNLKGVPMLDFFTGFMALMGFGFVLFRLRDPVYFIFVSYFAVFMLPGLLTIEAPQALRTITVIPAVLFFAAVYLKQLIENNNIKQVISILIIFLILFAVCAENIYTYFGPQAHDKSCRELFSTTEYEAAKYLSGLGPNWRGIVYSQYLQDSTFKFVARDKIKDCKIFDQNTAFQAARDDGHGAVYILPFAYDTFADAIVKTYKGSELFKHTDDYSGFDSGFIAVKVPEASVNKWIADGIKNGLTGSYYKGLNWQGQPVLTEKRQIIACKWKDSPVIPPSSSQWEGKILIDVPAEYTFIIQSRDYAELYIDGKRIIQNEGLETSGSKTKRQDGKITLSKGFHRVKIRQAVKEYYFSLSFWWIQPGKTQKELVPPYVLYY